MIEVAAWPIEVLDLHCVVYELPSDMPRDTLLERLAEDPRVESAQPMQLFATLTESYDDPYLPLQHGMESMQIRNAHRWSVGKGVRVAVVDTGIDRGHPELAGRVRVARDFVDRGSGDDAPELHGTAVAGVIGSAANNGIGIVGVAPEVRILALKACWQAEGTAAGAVCNSFTLAKALAFAVERRPEILNLSLEGPSDALLERLVGAALERGLVVVAARGDHTDGAPRFPASIPGVIAVGAAGAEDARPGAGAAGPEPTLLAPGKDILTTTPNGAYDFLSGSSFAAAHVSGVAALLIERSPGLTPERVRRLLEESTGAARSSAGAGVVDACAALAAIVPEVDCPQRSLKRPIKRTLNSASLLLRLSGGRTTSRGE